MQQHCTCIQWHPTLSEQYRKVQCHSQVECHTKWTGIAQDYLRDFRGPFLDLVSANFHNNISARMLIGLKRSISWARMTFKPAKYSTLVLKKGTVSDKHCFSLGGVQIFSMSENLVKTLGKILQSQSSRPLWRWKHGYQQWTIQDIQGISMYGFISMATCQGFSGHC